MISVAKRTGLAASERLQQSAPLHVLTLRHRVNLPIDALQHDDRGIDKDAEVDGANGDQVRRIDPVSTIMRKGKEHGKGNGDRPR